MRIFTDTGNIDSLKLLAASNFKKVDFRIENVRLDGKLPSDCHRGSLPSLLLPSGQVISSPNAATRYLFGDDISAENEHVVDQWLEWEATLLRPLIHANLLKPHPNTETRLKSLLQHLNKCLTSGRYILGTGISVADFVLWGGIYPVFLEKSRLPGQEDLKNLTSWFSLVNSQPACQSAVTSVFDGKSDHLDLIKTSRHHQLTPAMPEVCTRELRQMQISTSCSDTQKTEESGSSEPLVTEEEKNKVTEVFLNGRSSGPNVRERKHPILPQDGEKNYLITSALPYVNNVPHLGNIIGCVLSADVFSRYCRARNHNVLYICGTDEYGTATETKALEEGLTPQQICDKYNKLHAEIYEWFNIGFDYFGRTTTQEQTDIAQDIFWKLEQSGYILRDSLDQLKCLKCERFLADRFVEGGCPFCSYEDARGDQCDKCGKLINAVELKNPRCKACGSSPVVNTSQHLFMDLPNLEPLLVKHIDVEFERGVWSSNTKVITRSWIRDGLKPRCITRDLKWGTPVPLEGYTDKLCSQILEVKIAGTRQVQSARLTYKDGLRTERVFYVWYDAPIGYISITANYTDQWKKWWKNPDQVELYQFMAKDNVPFHSVIFPCSLLGTGDPWTVVKHLSATEYFNYEDRKFSKSRGIGVFGNDAPDTKIPADIWRFYLLFVRPESQDSAFSWEDLVTKNNSELLNNIGNFINRALMFVNNNFGGQISPMDLTDEDKELLALITRELKLYLDSMDKLRLRDGIRNILSISRLGNQYMQVNKPWVLVKGSDADKARAGCVTSLSANISCLISAMLGPYMPQVSSTIQQQLNAPKHSTVLTDQFVCYLPPGHKIGKPFPLFQKIELCKAKELQARYVGKQDERVAKPAHEKPSASAGPAVPVAAASQDVIDKLTQQVTEQGLVVRKLKTDKAEKSLIDTEVGKLLELKKNLALAQGIDPSKQTGGSGGKKKKNKK